MKISKHKLDVFEGEEHTVVIDGKKAKENYSWVIFHDQEYVYRHFKTFDTFKEAYAFMLKIFLAADIFGSCKINEKHWRAETPEIKI